jgi:nicotinate-nucleotide--dimethylbenzimidazole phosphoribosyltransferase
MEIGQALPGNVVACAGLGVGGDISAALVLARMTGVPVRELIVEHPNTPQDQLTRQLGVCQTALARHRDVHDPVEVLAAFGGFEMAMMTGMMLATAQRRALLIVDGLAACAALMTASRIAPAVTDYCVFARSQQHQGLNYALQLFHASALLELSMNSSDGSGAALAWPLISAAAALLTEVADGEEAGPTRPSSGYVGLSPAAPMQDDSMVDIPIAAPAAVGTATLMNTIGAIGQGTPADAANSIFTGFGENARPEIDDDLGMSLLDELSAADSTPAPPDSEPPTT